MTSLSNRSIIQNAYVVVDIDDAMASWTEVFGVGPWFCSREVQIDDARYRGMTTQVSFAGAIAQAGDVQVELIQPLDDAPSCYRDLYPAGTEGFHHVAVFAADFEEEIGRYLSAGFQVAFSGVSRDVHFGYVDTSRELGFMVEVLEDRPSIRTRFEMVAEAGRNWDGSDPVRGSSSSLSG